MDAFVAICMRNHTTCRLMFPLCSAPRRCSSWFASAMSSCSASYSAHTVVDVILFGEMGGGFFLMVGGTGIHPSPSSLSLGGEVVVLLVELFLG